MKVTGNNTEYTVHGKEIFLNLLWYQLTNLIHGFFTNAYRKKVIYQQFNH